MTDFLSQAVRYCQRGVDVGTLQTIVPSKVNPNATVKSFVFL